MESIHSVTHDTKLFTLRLPTASYLQVPTGHHLSIRATINGEFLEQINYQVAFLCVLYALTSVNLRDYSLSLSLSAGEEVERSYTPVSMLEHHPSQNEQEGEVVELMIKLYKDGKMSSFLSKLQQGTCVSGWVGEGKTHTPLHGTKLGANKLIAQP